jgi:hypothetical protein
MAYFICFRCNLSGLHPEPSDCIRALSRQLEILEKSYAELKAQLDRVERLLLSKGAIL